MNLKTLKAQLPGIIAVVIIVVNALEQAGTINLGVKLVVVLNAILGALGLGIIHLRQQQTPPTTK